MSSRSLRPNLSIRSFVIAVAVLVTPCLTARTQTPSLSIGANAGLVLPAGDLSTFTSSGYTVAATLGTRQSFIPIDLRVEGSLTELPWSNGSGVKHRLYGISLDGTANFGVASANGRLYLTGGVGTFGWKDSGGSFDTITIWNVGINAGLGYYLPLSGFDVHLEGRYRNVFSSTNQRMFPITVGIAF